MAITTEMIKELRGNTGAGILECRKALEQSNGDMNAALDYLREKGLAQAQKRANRVASEGIIELYSHMGGRMGVMLELNCETDFVGKSEAFQKLAHELALQIAVLCLGVRRGDAAAGEQAHQKGGQHAVPVVGLEGPLADFFYFRNGPHDFVLLF